MRVGVVIDRNGLSMLCYEINTAYFELIVRTGTAEPENSVNRMNRHVIATQQCQH